VKAFEDEVGEGEADLTWISEHDYHLVLHEVHRAIRNPAVAEKITIPVDEIKSPSPTSYGAASSTSTPTSRSSRPTTGRPSTTTTSC